MKHCHGWVKSCSLFAAWFLQGWWNIGSFWPKLSDVAARYLGPDETSMDLQILFSLSTNLPNLGTHVWSRTHAPGLEKPVRSSGIHITYVSTFPAKMGSQLELWIAFPNHIRNVHYMCTVRPWLDIGTCSEHAFRTCCKYLPTNALYGQQLLKMDEHGPIL